MVAIVDPHLKRDHNYPAYKEAMDLDILVKSSNGNNYEGWCWPGSSAWVDFFNPAAWTWWQGLFSLKDKEGVKWRWEKSSKNLFIWNDMNEVGVRRLLSRPLSDKIYSPLYSMDPKSPCKRTTFIMEAGNTVTFTISMACFT